MKIKMNHKASLSTTIFFVLALSLTITPALAVSPLLSHTMIFQGDVEHGYVHTGGPVIIKPANGRAIVFVRDNPGRTDHAFLVAFCEIPSDNIEFKVRLVSLFEVNPVQFYEDHVMLYGYFNVYVNNTLLYSDEFGYFNFNWVSESFTIYIPDHLVHVHGSPTQYKIT